MVLRSTGHAYSVLRGAQQPNAYFVQHGTRIGRKDTDTKMDEAEHFNANGVLFHADHYDLNWSLHDAMLTTRYRQEYTPDTRDVRSMLLTDRLNTITR